MATDSPRSSSRDQSPGTVWQVPAFLIGAAVVFSLAASHHAFRPAVQDGERLLEKARALVHDGNADPKATVAAAELALASTTRTAGADSAPAAEAHFLLGSARLRLAIVSGMPEASQADLTLAQTEFDAARPALEEALRPRFEARSARTAALLRRDDPATIVDRLTKSLDHADDKSDAYSLIAEAHLRKSPPDLAAAVEATTAQLRSTPVGDSRPMHSAKLRLADLLVKLGRAAEARPLVEKIGKDAPAEVFYAARAVHARACEEAGDWDAAARNWEQAADDPQLKPADKAERLYFKAQCCARTQRTADASAAWAEAIKLGGPASRAAGLRLAESRLDSGPASSVIEALTVALQGVTTADQWPSRLIPIAETRGAVARTFQQFRSRAEFDAALKLAGLFAALAPPGDDLAMAGLVADDRAQALTARAAQAPSDQVAGLEDQSRTQYAVAAQAYEAAADKVPPGALRANWLINSADRYARAGQADRGVAVLARLAEVGPVEDECAAAAWYALGESLHQRNEPEKARAAYLKCAGVAGPLQAKARLQLGLLDLAENKFDVAERTLAESHATIKSAPQPDVAVLAPTEYALADAAYQRESRKPDNEPRDFSVAEQRLLASVQQYPDHAWAPKARFCLGKIYWYAATQRSQATDPRANSDQGTMTTDERAHIQRQMNESLRKAMEQFEAVQTTLSTRRTAGNLSPDDASRLRLAEFSVAECCYFLGRYEDSISRYLVLADRYRLQVEELAALSQVWRAQAMGLKQVEQARATLQKFRASLAQTPATAFNGSTPYHHQTFWMDWLDKAQQATPGGESGM